jgi:exosortase A
MEKTEAEIPSSEAGGTGIRQAWIISALVWVLLLGGLVATFWSTASAIVDIWLHSSTFNHCTLILPIVGYLVWERRVIFTHLKPQPCFLGVLAIALGGLVWLAGSVADAQVVQQFAFAIMLQASVLAIFGRAVARALVFPLFYLFFAVPAGEFLVPKLQDITAHITVLLLKITGLPVFSDGVFISVPNGEFHVAEACSGVRFLIASLPLGVLFANIAFLTWWRRAIVIFLSLLVPIIANGIRAYGIIMIAYLTNNQYALGVDHLIYGWIFFAFVTMVFLGIGMLFMNRPYDMPALDVRKFPPQGDKAPSFILVVMAGALALAAANAGRLYGTYMESRPETVAALTLLSPQATGSWKAVPPAVNNVPWEPSYQGVDTKLLQRYVRDDGVSVTLYLGYYSHQRHGAEVLAYGNTVAAPEPWSWASGGRVSVPFYGRDIEVNAAWIVAGYDRRRVWYWYWVDHQFTADSLVAKFLIAKSKLARGNSEAAIIAVSVGDVATNEKKLAVLQDFLAHLKPEPPILAGN